jgi:hypothetical protein
VVLNRGTASDGLYVVGGKSYVVSSQNEARTIRAADIVAVVEPASAVAAK